jgi:biotin carboxyl carrier protein
VKLFLDGQECEFSPSEAEVSPGPDRLYVRTADGTHTALAVRQGDTVLVSYRGAQYRLERRPPSRARSSAAASGELRAPMPGQIVDVLVEPGATVAKGDRILVLEAMKTQQPFVAPFDGVVTEIPVDKGDQVAEGAVLARVEGAEGKE